MKSKFLAPKYMLGALFIFAILITSCTGRKDSWPGISNSTENGRVIVSYKKTVSSLNADKSRNWTYPDDDDRDAQFFAAAVVQDGRVYIGDYEGRIHAIDEETGEKIWVYEPERATFLGFTFGSTDRVIGSIEIHDNLLYFGNEHAIWALDIEGDSPEEAWSFETEHSVWGQPVYVDGEDLGIDPVLFATSLDHNVYAIDPIRGTKLWSVDTGGGIPDRVLYDATRGMLYAGTLNKEMVAIDILEQRVVDRYETEGWLWGTPTAYDGKLYFGDLSGWLYELELNGDGAVFGTVAKKQLTDGEPLRATPLIVEDPDNDVDVLVIGSEDGNVYAFDLGTINWISARSDDEIDLRWKQDVDAKAVSNLTWVEKEEERLVIIGTEEDDRLVVALRLNDGGEREWSYKYDD